MVGQSQMGTESDHILLLFYGRCWALLCLLQSAAKRAKIAGLTETIVLSQTNMF
jgi:hypothetical protein